ncbi:MAG: DUF6273 domain-containing protein, partial [Clostridiales bacterium]|nr:DUF6273 domain-containing protein [Clostridiales bacterium]
MDKCRIYTKRCLSFILSIAVVFCSAGGLSFISFGEENTNPVSGKAVGDTVQFGSYPQSQVTDKTLISALNGLELNWISYGYYSGDGTEGTAVQRDYMYYCDIEYDGCMYRGVSFSEFRPQYTYETTKYIYSTINANGFKLDTVYWFKYEPLNWIVLDPNEGLALCKTVIDSQAFSNTVYQSIGGEYYNTKEYTAYACDYESSSVRAWLNGDFYTAAFDESEREYINTAKLDNSADSASSEKYAGADTEDRVFLLSHRELITGSYGLIGTSAMKATATEYAEVQGIYYGSSFNANVMWWTRTETADSNIVAYIGIGGGFETTHTVDNASIGIRPALKFAAETQHNYTSAVTEPTCTEGGYTTYTCTICGDTYIGGLTEAKGHTVVIDKAVEATCTQSGLTEGSHCSVCG